jgi:RimJ/RimL family protein N-acetyltransferase
MRTGTPTPKPASALRVKLESSPIPTERLLLRALRLSDAGLIFNGYATDVEAIRWMGFWPHESVRVTERLVANWVAAWDNEIGPKLFVVESGVDRRFLGIVDLELGAHGAVIGYVFCRDAWGQGYATEAVRRIVDLAFEHFAVWRVWATCAPQNPASKRVLEKAGMRHEGVLRRWIVSPLVSPEPRDSDCLAITRDDWLAADTDRA